MMTNLLLLTIVFGVAWIDWFIYGKKGDALIDRSPWLIFWACGEASLGVVAGFVVWDAYQSREWFRIVGVLGATVVGCALGIITSRVIDWKKWRMRHG
jgi:hypothetical protein